MTEKITNELLPITTDQIDVSPSATVTSNTVPMSTIEDTNITTTSGDTRTLPTTVIKGIASTMPESSLQTNPATTVNKPTTTTELLGKNIDHSISTDQTATESDKKGDVYVVIAESDSKVNTVLSATSLALFLVLAIAMFILVVVLLCAHKRKSKGSKSAKVELKKMSGFTMKTTESIHVSSTYTSPIHTHYCSEEKVDIM